MTRRAAFAAITILTLVVFARPFLRNEVFSFRDHSDYFQPLRWFTATELQHGRLPLWNVYSASGEPWLANPQTAVFYPPAWLFLVLPFAFAYTLFLFLHVVLLGCGGYLLFARLTRPGGAALAAAIALAFSGPAMSLLDVSNNLTTFAWIPLIVWCALEGVSARASAAAIAMSFLAGEPFFAAVGALLFVIARRKGIRDLIDVALTSFALSAVQLLPFLAMVMDSDRAHGGVTRDATFSATRCRWATGFGWPFRPTLPAGGLIRISHSTSSPIRIRLLMAAFAVWYFRRRRRGWVAAIVVVGGTIRN